MEDFLKMHLALFFLEEESTIFWWIFLVPEVDGSPILFTYSVDGDLIVIFFCGLVNVSLLLRLAKILVRNLPSPRNWDEDFSDGIVVTSPNAKRYFWMTFYYFSQHSTLTA